MSITGLQIENFKGIDELQDIPLRRMTIFLGANSAGKSSCIHALAVLSQTIKLPNNLSPLALDDEFASVHLGRWREVVHNKSYTGTMRLGLRISEHEVLDLGKDGSGSSKLKGEIAACFTFKSSLRTQEISLEAAEYQIGSLAFALRHDAKARTYRVTRGNSGLKATVTRRAGFLMSEVITLPPQGGRAPMSPEFFVLLQLQAIVQRELLSVLYLGPFRQAPRRRYPTRGVSPTEVGAEGEAAITMLANEVVRRQRRPHIDEIAGWLAALGLAKHLQVKRVGKSDLFDVNLTLADGASFPIADLGYGISQVLPVLTQCSFAPDGALLLFEQPELHLHPLAARPLANVFVDAVKKNRTVVLETHSPELVHGVQELVRAGRIRASDVGVYLVTRDGKKTALRLADIDSDGEIQENWEKGISKRY